ncbi:hypothetical protein ATKI12_7687 [Kitasatospora sp. Ki12]
MEMPVGDNTRGEADAGRTSQRHPFLRVGGSRSRRRRGHGLSGQECATLWDQLIINAIPSQRHRHIPEALAALR